VILLFCKKPIIEFVFFIFDFAGAAKQINQIRQKM
jgi:hypothetical protein